MCCLKLEVLSHTKQATEVSFTFVADCLDLKPTLMLKLRFYEKGSFGSFDFPYPWVNFLSVSMRLPLFLMKLCYSSCKLLHKTCEKFLRRIVGEIAAVIKELGCSSKIGFRLCHGRYIYKNQRLTQMMIRSPKHPNTYQDKDNTRDQRKVPMLYSSHGVC